MKQYDVLVIGGGSGTHIVDVALNHGNSVALAEMDRLGGTCLNYGCIPTKMLTYPADIAATIKKASKLGIEAEIKNRDFQEIMQRMRNSVRESVEESHETIKSIPELDFYREEASFKDNYTLTIDGQEIQADKIFLATGARPYIPPIKGIKDIDIHTNETILQLNKKPSSIAMIGGGYITSEFAHFFHEMDVDVKIIQRNKELVPELDKDIKKTLKNIYTDKMEVHVKTEAKEIQEKNNTKKIICQTKDGEKTITAETILVATGRQSNADKLNLENTDIETDTKNYIKTNKKMETTQKDVWALGDATGKHMFKHTANREARTAAENAFHNANQKMNYHANPRGIYSYPPIASVGHTEKQAKKQHNNILIGKAKYNEVAKGQAMKEKNGLTKTIIKEENHEILGYHIIGPQAPILIQEITNIMQNNQTTAAAFNGMHIHPSLTEITQKPFTNLKPPK